jgi:hypothetical protein
LQVIVIGVVTFCDRNKVDSIALLEVDLKVVDKVRKKLFSVFVEIDYNIRKVVIKIPPFSLREKG